MPRLADVLDMARYESIPRKDNTQDIAAVILASQTAMADVITRNFKGEIKDQVCAECASITSTLENALRAFVKAEIAALPVPERAIVERTVETVTEREEREDDEPKTVTVQRKDGVISTVKVGSVTFDVVRNKQGLIKEAVPRV